MVSPIGHLPGGHSVCLINPGLIWDEEVVVGGYRTTHPLKFLVQTDDSIAMKEWSPTFKRNFYSINIVFPENSSWKSFMMYMLVLCCGHSGCQVR